MDIAVRQNIPAFREDHSAQVYFVMNNFTNFINDEWGILEEVNFNTASLGTSSPESRQGDASLWEMRVGIDYRF